jgi:hypothetical protein
MSRVLVDVLNSRCWHHQAQAAAHYLRGALSPQPVTQSPRLVVEAPRLVLEAPRLSEAVASRLVVAVARQRTWVVAPQPAASLWLGVAAPLR